jgi:hypothetical protein
MARMTRAVRVTRSRCFLTQLYVALAALALPGLVLAAGDETPWPHVRVPQQVETFDIGHETVVNGTPVRMRGFMSGASPAVLAASFRQVLSKPLVEDRRGETLVLGRGDGRYYVTVQLVPFGSGTRGFIAVTRPPVNQEAPGDMVAVRRLLSALPPGSTLASHTSSIDGETRAEHDAIVNDHSIGLNSDYVKRMLHADGFILERESGPSPAMHSRAHVAADARTLFFKRPGAEATAVLFSSEKGQSVIVLNRVRFAGPAK